MIIVQSPETWDFSGLCTSSSIHGSLWPSRILSHWQACQCQQGSCTSVACDIHRVKKQSFSGAQVLDLLLLISTLFSSVVMVVVVSQSHLNFLTACWSCCVGAAWQQNGFPGWSASRKALPTHCRPFPAERRRDQVLFRVALACAVSIHGAQLKAFVCLLWLFPACAHSHYRSYQTAHS